MPDRLRISENGRYFLRGDKPFFWLGDTAWLLFRKLTMAEIKRYLDNRAQKGFTAIQVTLVHEKHTTNPAGSPALLNENFGTPNADMSPGSFWQQVDKAIQYAASLGLVMALLPSWGNYYESGAHTADTIGPYTDFLAERFGSYPNVLWLVGGDVRGDKAHDTFCLMGEALRKKCPEQLVGYHPFGRCSSSMWFHNCAWLDFNMFQSGHRDYTQQKLDAWDDKADADRWVGEDNFRYVQQDMALEPPKPTLDGEPSYELIPHGLHDTTKPYWQACDVRRYAYWSVLTGAAGHTYGDNAIMQFWNGEGTPAFGALHPWQEALHNPGSMQMGHMRRLMESLPWYEGHSHMALLNGPPGQEHAYNPAFLTETAACVYTYTGVPFAINAGELPFDQGYAYWFDPVIGGASYIGDLTLTGIIPFTPPNRRIGQQDWVLVLTKDRWGFHL